MDFIPVYEEKVKVKGQLAQLQYHRKYSRILVFVSIKSNELLLIRKLILLDMLDMMKTVLKLSTHVWLAGYEPLQLKKVRGKGVTKGSFIYALYAPDLVNAQHEYLLAMNSSNPLLIRAAEGNSRRYKFQVIKYLF